MPDRSLYLNAAGIRADAAADKEGKYDPRGGGAAWSHNFLNQKPWHPLNFRNQARVFEAEQAKIDADKKRAVAKVLSALHLQTQ